MHVVPLTIEQNTIVLPWQLCTKLVHDCPVWPNLCESAHVFQVTGGIAGKNGKLALQIHRQPVNNLSHQSFARLAGENVLSDLPMMQDQSGFAAGRLHNDRTNDLPFISTCPLLVSAIDLLCQRPTSAAAR